MNNTRKEIIKNSLRAALGLVIFAFGVDLTIRANMGAAPWDVLNIGLAGTLGTLYGNISVSVSVILVIIDILLKEKIGIGTILDAILVGKTIDLIDWIGIIPLSKNIPISIGMLLLGFIIEGIGQYIYMKSGLSCGPRDSLQVAISRRLPKIKFGVVNIMIQVIVLGIGLLAGGPLGITAAVAVFGCGIMQQVVFDVVKFDPASIKHQGIVESFKILFGKGGNRTNN